MSLASRNARRAYDNSLREEHAAETKRRILEAVAHLVWEDKVEEFSIAKAAERSGVSAATIYRYFPNRTALLDAVNEWLGEQLGRPPFPNDLEALIEGAPQLFEYYERNYDKLRMARATAAARELREHGQRERDRALAELLAPITGHLPPEKANAIAAIGRALHGFDVYELMTERFGVGREDASDALRWAMRTLVAALEREGAAASREKTKRGVRRRARREGER